MKRHYLPLTIFITKTHGLNFKIPRLFLFVFYASLLFGCKSSDYKEPENNDKGIEIITPLNLSLFGNKIYESHAPGTLIGWLSTTVSSPNGTFTYTILPGGDQKLFNIPSGKNILTSAASFDYSTKQSYSITIRTTDNAGLYFDKIFSIKVLPVSNYARMVLQKTNLIKQIKSDTTLSDYQGIEETYIQYLNKGDSAMAISFVKIDLTNPKISVEAVTPFDSLKSGFQTVSTMIMHKNRHAAAERKKVIAGINGDYFNPQGKPLGLVYKNSQMILPWLDSIKPYYYMGILKDSKQAIIGDKSSFLLNSGALQEALGARYLLVRDGNDQTSTLNKNIEPRTAIGVLSPSTIVILTVDGRQSAYSNGFSFVSLSKVFRAIGATDAVNLDGGGSTVLIIKDKSDLYKIKNKPSGGSERAVANSWMILQKD